MSHPFLKVTMTFEWSCGVLEVRTSFALLCMCVCVCLFLKKKKKKKKKKEEEEEEEEWVIVSYCLREYVVCNITCSTLP